MAASRSLRDCKALLEEQSGAGRRIQPAWFPEPNCHAQLKDEWTVLNASRESEQEKQHWLSCIEAREHNTQVSNGINQVINRLGDDLMALQPILHQDPVQSSSLHSVLAKSRTMAELAAFPPTFRHVPEQDLPRLRQIEVTCRSFGSWPLDLEELRALNREEPCLLLGAYLGSQMVGFIRGARESGGVIRLSMFGVDTPYRGCQLGIKLLEAWVFRLRLLAAHSLHRKLVEGGVVVTAPGGLARLLCQVGFGSGDQTLRVKTVDRVSALMSGAQSPEITLTLAITPVSQALLSFGVIANAAIDDAGMGIPGDGNTPFHHTPLRVLRETVNAWKHQAELCLIVHIGDAVSHEQTHTQALSDLAEFHSSFQPLMPITLAHVLNQCRVTGLEQAKQVLRMPPDQHPWFELKPAPEEVVDTEAAWRCLVVDVYDTPGRETLGISKEQYYWLIKKLRRSEERGHAVLVAMHLSPILTERNPKYPSDEYRETMKQILDVLGQFRYTIRAVISGDGSEHHRNIDGINFIGIPSLVDEGARAAGKGEPDVSGLG